MALEAITFVAVVVTSDCVAETDVTLDTGSIDVLEVFKVRSSIGVFEVFKVRVVGFEAVSLDVTVVIDLVLLAVNRFGSESVSVRVISGDVRALVEDDNSSEIKAVNFDRIDVASVKFVCEETFVFLDAITPFELISVNVFEAE